MEERLGLARNGMHSPRACVIKHYELVMYGLCCLLKLVTVLAKYKETSLLRNLSISRKIRIFNVFIAQTPVLSLACDAYQKYGQR